MDREYFNSGMKYICSHFTKPHPEKVISSIWPEVKDLPNQAINAASKRVEQEFHPGQLVAIGKIKDIILQEGRKILEAEAIQREQEDRRQRTETPESLPKGHTEYSRACCLFLKAAFSRYYTLDELRKMAEDGERRFPGRGFDAWLKGSLNKGKVLPIDRMQKAAGE